MVPGTVAELEHADVAVGGGARQQAARFVGGPGHQVDRGRVVGELGDFLPLAGLFSPDQHFAVVAAGGEDVAVFGMRLFGGRWKGGWG